MVKKLCRNNQKLEAYAHYLLLLKVYIETISWKLLLFFKCLFTPVICGGMLIAMVLSEDLSSSPQSGKTVWGEICSGGFLTAVSCLFFSNCSFYQVFYHFL